MSDVIQTFEGHTNSVLRVDFLSSGMQLVTSSSDGLVKLWNIKDESCVKTLDNHEDKASRPVHLLFPQLTFWTGLGFGRIVRREDYRVCWCRLRRYLLARFDRG